MPFTNPTMYIVDGNFAVILESEKVVLFEELLKHCGPQWREELASGQEVKAGRKISGICKTLNIEAQFIPGPIQYLNVLNEAATGTQGEQTDVPAAENTPPDAAPKTEPKSAPKPKTAPKPEESGEAKNPMVPN